MDLVASGWLGERRFPAGHRAQMAFLPVEFQQAAAGSFPAVRREEHPQEASSQPGLRQSSADRPVRLPRAAALREQRAQVLLV